MNRSRVLRTIFAAAAIAAGAGSAGPLWPPAPALAQAAPRAAAAPTGCGAPTYDEIGAASDADALGTVASDSARADFDRKAQALGLAARERVANRADGADVAVPQSLVNALLASCRYGEWAQKRAVTDLAPFSNGAKHWRNAAEMRFFVYISSAEVAVEARGVGDPALVAKLYAAIEPEIPLASVRGRYHPMRWPAD